MLPQLTRLKGLALDLLFPPGCVGCGRGGDWLCPSCRRSLPVIVPPLCPRCGLPQASGVLCPACAGGTTALDGIRAPFRFDGVMRQAIHWLKYRNLRVLAEPLAGLLGDYFDRNPLPAEVLVAVPLHPRRLRERGYNQSRLLAGELARLTGLPVVDGCLVRQRHTPPQARTTSVDERRRHLAGAFACRDGRLRGKQVLLVDDVATSGATLGAAAVALKAAGAASVWGLVLAREV
ncbi:MAG: ComF family protein [Chloroflexota bacterium]